MGRFLGTAKSPQQIGSMIDNRCAICETRISSSTPRSYFCWRCFKKYEDDIKSQVAWTRYLVNLEKRRRFRSKKLAEANISFIYLGNKWDIDENGRLIRRDGYNG